MTALFPFLPLFLRYLLCDVADFFLVSFVQICTVRKHLALLCVFFSTISIILHVFVCVCVLMDLIFFLAC